MTQKAYFNATPKWIRNLLMLIVLTAMPSLTSHAETPHEFVNRFVDFKYVFHEKIQEPGVFLSSRAGDCDDFATLADSVLRNSGYTPRLFAVRMKGETHVVCYIPEVGAYLDYNYRAEEDPLIATDGSVTDIAHKVAKSFGRSWHAAYEFTYQRRVKWLVDTIRFNKPNAKPFLVAAE